MNKAYDELRNRVAEVVDLFGAGWPCSAGITAR